MEGDGTTSSENEGKALKGQAREVEEKGMGTKQEMQEWMLSVGIVFRVSKESTGALYH